MSGWAALWILEQYKQKPEHKPEDTWFDELALRVGLLILPIATKIVYKLLCITLFIYERLEKL